MTAERSPQSPSKAASNSALDSDSAPEQAAPAPTPAKPSGSVAASSPSPSPKPLTPEQRQNLRFQQQLERISQTTITVESAATSQPRELITAVQSGDRQLTLTFSPGWYSFTIKQQDDLAAALAEKSQALGFPRLRLEDQAGRLVARNPVVGDQMVILRR